MYEKIITKNKDATYFFFPDKSLNITNQYLYFG